MVWVFICKVYSKSKYCNNFKQVFSFHFSSLITYWCLGLALPFFYISKLITNFWVLSRYVSHVLIYKVDYLKSIFVSYISCANNSYLHFKVTMFSLLRALHFTLSNISLNCWANSLQGTSFMVFNHINDWHCYFKLLTSYLPINPWK